MKKNSLAVLIIIFMLVGLLIFFMPDIYNKLQELDTPNVQNKDGDKIEKDEIEPITIDSDIVKSLTYPIMRNDKYKEETYYKFDKININNFNNNDILYNAFLDIYEGYLVDHVSVGCSSNSKEFDATYLVSRIKNIIGRDIKYTLEDFIVPNLNRTNSYVGTWKYNSENNTYVYYGDCNNNNKSNTIYYDLEKLYKVDSSADNNRLYLYYYIGIAKIDNDKYTIYSDINMTNEVSSGIVKNIDDINNVFNDLDMKLFKVYKYTFKKGLCTYDNYCFYQGEWVND